MSGNAHMGSAGRWPAPDPLAEPGSARHYDHLATDSAAPNAQNPSH